MRTLKRLTAQRVLVALSSILVMGTAHAGTYADWVEAYGLPNNASDPTNAPAGDGIPNLLKFAMGLDPNTPGPSPLFQPVLVRQGGQPLFGLNLSLDSTAQGARLNLYASLDLRTWTPCEAVLQKEADLGSGMMRVQMLNNESISSSGPFFLRLGAELTQFGQFITSPPVPVLTNVVGTNGATLTVPAPASPLGGLLLTVPAGAYPNQQTNTISYAPIIAHNFPSSINPITPLIRIENGGALASQLMTVTVPVSLSSNEFAMGFIYHSDTGELEGMPLLGLSTNSITVGTRHFSWWFITKIPYSLLPKSVDSGFRPGVDDWDFANYGSFLSPNGFCEGSCQSEMWFYINKKSQGAPPLNKLYQNSLYPFRTTDLWADNILGIELASVVQSDVGLSLASLAGKIYSVSDTLTLDAFTYSMWVTGEPQLMGLSKFYMDVTHAIVAFRMDHGTIYVADPNFPGDTTRQVVYDPTAEAFKAYYLSPARRPVGESNWGQCLQPFHLLLRF